MNAEEQKPPQGLRSVWQKSISIVPGTLVCFFITLLAIGAQYLEERELSHPYVEALVMAIIFGIAVRSFWQPGTLWQPGINFSAKLLLEIAVMLLGASISIGAIMASGAALLIGIAATVILALASSYAISRLLGLPQRISILIACGNSICGNSAIATVAPVIGASNDDIASSIAFTAVLGVVVVLALPLTFPLLGLNEIQYGTLAGLTVYAVPQVLAATVPIGFVATQIGTLVKLIRVLMLGPVVVVLSLVRKHIAAPIAETENVPKLRLFQFIPWFIVGFLGLASLRSLGLIPDAALRPLRVIAGLFTVVSMAALGLGVDIRVIGRLGGRVTFAVVGSLVVLVAISLLLIRILKIG